MKLNNVEYFDGGCEWFIECEGKVYGVRIYNEGEFDVDVVDDNFDKLIEFVDKNCVMIES